MSKFSAKGRHGEPARQRRMKPFWRIVLPPCPVSAQGEELYKNFDRQVIHAYIYGQVHFAVELLCTPHPLVAAFGYIRAGVDFAMTVVNHQPFKIRLVKQGFKKFSHIRLSRQRINRWCTAPHLPYSGGNATAPRAQYPKAALTSRRLSLATHPHCPLCSGRRGSSGTHVSSVMWCRRCAFFTRAASVCGALYYILKFV